MTVSDIKGSLPVSFTLPPDANGIMPDRMIAAMADAGLIRPAYPFVESQIQPARSIFGWRHRLSRARKLPARSGRHGRRAHRRI